MKKKSVRKISLKRFKVCHLTKNKIMGGYERTHGKLCGVKTR
jgi:hypothetical protein